MVDSLVRLSPHAAFVIEREFNAQQLRNELPNDATKRKKDLLRTIVWTGITAGLIFIGRTVINNSIDIPLLKDCVNWISCVGPFVPAIGGLIRWEWNIESAKIKEGWAQHYNDQAADARNFI